MKINELSTNNMLKSNNIKESAQELVGVFLAQMLKIINNSESEGLLDDSKANMYKSMQYDIYADSISKNTLMSRMVDDITKTLE